jgi:prepilin-type N-terminal cleavage/methylation domain-containing protein
MNPRPIDNRQSTIDNSALSVASLRRRTRGFTLVELLTVIFIIGLLIAILIPSLGAARNTAKKLSSQKALTAIDAGLELFRGDHEKEFTQTNGYPSSFVHPPIPDATPPLAAADLNAGRFPFVAGYPRVYGAHYLPFFLMGLDARGYISRKDVPDVNSLKTRPERWYEPDAAGDKTIARSPLYVDPNGIRLVPTRDLPGQQPANLTVLFPDWGDDRSGMNRLPVIVDAFDQPILYYAANRHGRDTNIVEDMHDPANNYAGTQPQEKGPPYYFHQDNAGFTGDKDNVGWNFGTSSEDHAIRQPGEALDAAELLEEEKKETFARYVLDRKIYQNLRQKSESGQQVEPQSPLRPVNADSYILVSPGVDGRYGTSDDVSNLPPWPDE